MSLKPSDIAAVKGKGFLRNRGTDCFSGRIVAPGTVFSAEDLKTISYIAQNFGNGKAFATSRLSIEISGIPHEKIEECIAYAEAHGLYFGGTGAKIRPIAACKGTTCVFGNFDTQGLAEKIHNEFYLGWKNVTLPHKFKIGVGGCPNSCMKPSLNDVGIEGHSAPVINLDNCRGCANCAIVNSCPMKAASLKEGKISIDSSLCLTCGVCAGKCPFGAIDSNKKVEYQIYVGGTWGKRTRMGTPLKMRVGEAEILSTLEKIILWYRDNAYNKERLGMAVDRIGAHKMEADISGDDLILRKEEILKKEIPNRE